MAIQISLITPVFNRADLTYKFLAQNWIKYGSKVKIEWIIIDNGSYDNTDHVLRTWGSTFRDRLRVIKNSHNEGFSIACNQGAAEARGNILIFINNDVNVGGDYLAPLVDVLYENPGDLVGAEILTHNTGWNKFGNEDPIPYIPGWCLGMTKRTFDDLGGFDERFAPFDYEDMDLSYAAVLAGRELIQVNLPLLHMSGQTGKTIPNRETVTINNRVKFADKWGLSCA